MTHSSLGAPKLRLMFSTLGGIHSIEGAPLPLLYVSGIHQLKLFVKLFLKIIYWNKYELITYILKVGYRLDLESLKSDPA